MAGRHRKPPQRRATGRHRRPSSRPRMAVPALAAAVVLGAGGVGAAAAFTDGSAPPARLPGPVLPSTPPTVVVSPAAAAPTPGPASTSPVRATGHHRHPPVALRLAVPRSVSWVEVTRPTGQVLFQGMLRRGHRLTYRHGPLDVTVGNAGAVRIVRGTHVRYPAGKSGQVLRFTVRTG